MGNRRTQAPVTPTPEAQNKPAVTPTPSTDSQPPISQEPPIDSTEGPHVPEFGTLLDMFRYFADTSTDDEEKALLLELIELLEANPDQEDEFTKLLILELATQVKAALAKPDAAVEELDERTIRLRAAAQAELDTLYAGSKARQEKAEAQAAEAQEDRRNKE